MSKPRPVPLMRTRLIVFVIVLLVSPFALYYLARFTYHQGWWGRDNLLARALWLCSAPQELEQTFYPDKIEVVVPGCQTSGSGVVALPSGRYLYVPNAETGVPVLFDIHSDQKIPFNRSVLPPGGYVHSWLTDDLIVGYVLPGSELFLARLTDQSRIPLLRLDEARPDLLLEDETLNEAALINVLKEAEQVYSVGDAAVVLVSDYWNHPDENFIFSESLLPDREPGWIGTLLTANNIPYKQGGMPCRGSPDSVSSPGGRFVAKPDGVYENASGRKIADYGLPSQVWYQDWRRYRPCSWLPDERAVILMPGAQPVWVIPPIEIAPGIGSPGFLKVPQPFLKFNLP
jgi:hypothetical protein